MLGRAQTPAHRHRHDSAAASRMSNQHIKRGGIPFDCHCAAPAMGCAMEQGLSIVQAPGALYRKDGTMALPWRLKPCFSHIHLSPSLLADMFISTLRKVCPGHCINRH